MRPQQPRDRVIEPIAEFLADPRFVTALTTTAIGVSVFAFALRQSIGWAGLIGMLAAIVILAAAVFAARREAVEWRGILPISLLAFLGWAGLSIFWSQYHWSTLWGLAYLACFTAIGLFVALLRDTIQIVRAYGDVLRFALGVSIAIEIISGLLIDSPIRFLAVLGDLDDLGPIQGIMGARNQLGILAVLAIVTFATEFRTHSVSRVVSVGSVGLAGITLLFTRSPLAFGAVIIALIAAAALYGVRRVKPASRRVLQLALLVATGVIAALAWAFRSPIIDLFNAGGDLTYRIQIWHQTFDFIGLQPLLGWGWIGTWRSDVSPFLAFTTIGGRETTNASNAFLDVWLQLGLIGFAIFAGLVLLTFTRSWLLAGRRRSIVFAWPALALIVLVVAALAESSLLTEYSWVTFVVCTVKAAQQLSWRRAFAAVEPVEPVDEPA